MEPVNTTPTAHIDNDCGIADIRGFLGAVIRVTPVVLTVDFVPESDAAYVQFAPMMTTGYVIIEHTLLTEPSILGGYPVTGRCKSYLVDGELTHTELLSGCLPYIVRKSQYHESIQYVDYAHFRAFKIMESSMESAGSDTAANVYNKAEVDTLITAEHPVAAPNTTITHLTTTIEPIANFRLSYPVFASGAFGYAETLSPTDCICAVKHTGSYKEFVGICTGLRPCGSVSSVYRRLMLWVPISPQADPRSARRNTFRSTTSNQPPSVVTDEAKSTLEAVSNDSQATTE